MKGDKNLIFVILAVVIQLVLIRAEGIAGEVELEKIVVTPSRIEESSGEISRKVDVITSKDIENSSGKCLAEVLTELTSVNISDYGGLGATKNIRMRGSSASGVLVMIDSRPINSPRSGEAELATIPLENIERIEVVHGPASSLYGSSAMGGVVNIITKNPPEERQVTEFTTSFGTYRTYLEELVHGARLDKIGYLVTSSYQSSQGNRDHSEYIAKNVSTKLEYELNAYNKFVLNSGYHRSDLETPGSLSYFDYDDYQKTFKDFFDLSWNSRLFEDTNANIRVYQNYERLEFIEGPYNAWGDEGKSTHSTKGRGLDIQFNHDISNFYQLIWGFNGITNINDSNKTGKHKYIVRAGYMQNNLNLWDKLKFTLGGRLDDYSNFGTEFCPSFSFLYNLNKDTKLHGLIARSFRAPTFNDLYWPSISYGPGWGGEEGNPDLKPERGITGEVGVLTKFFKFLQTDLTYFRSKYDDLINWVEDADLWWRPKNIDSAVIDGIESENKVYLGNNLELNLGYTFLRAKNDKTHNYLVYQPKHKFDCSLRYTGLNGFNIEFRSQFTDTRFHNAANTVKVKRFFILGIDISKKFGNNLTCFASIDNLLNKEYQVIRDYPMPGFSLTAGAKLEF